MTTFAVRAATEGEHAFCGVDSSNYHDDISHHGGDPVKLAGIQKVNTFYATQFASLLAKLAAATDVDGSPVLDNCAIIFTSEFGDGDDHYHYDLPVVLAGGPGARSRPAGTSTTPARRTAARAPSPPPAAPTSPSPTSTSRSCRPSASP